MSISLSDCIRVDYASVRKEKKLLIMLHAKGLETSNIRRDIDVVCTSVVCVLFVGTLLARETGCDYFTGISQAVFLAVFVFLKMFRI